VHVVQGIRTRGDSETNGFGKRRSVLGWMSGEAEDSVVGGSKRLMEWFSLAGFFEHDYTCVSQDDASFGRRLGGRLGLRRWIVFF
jgi:hypothetical protein